MGNFRSGRWRKHKKKELVDDAFAIDVRDLLGGKSVLHAGNGFIPVRTYAGRIVGQAVAHLVAKDDGTRAVAFPIRFRNEPVWQAIPILLPFDSGGRRETVLACPNESCAARCRKLYLPSGCTRFLCRRCHDLTYASQQRHDPRIRRLKRNPDRLIELLDADPAEIGISRTFLLLRAGRACIRELEAQLPPAVVEVVNAVFLAAGENGGEAGR